MIDKAQAKGRVAMKIPLIFSLLWRLGMQTRGKIGNRGFRGRKTPIPQVFGEGVKSARGEIAILGCGDHT